MNNVELFADIVTDVTVKSLLINVVGNLSYFVICKPTLQVGRLELSFVALFRKMAIPSPQSPVPSPRFWHVLWLGTKRGGEDANGLE